MKTQLVITIDPQGRINIQGPLQDRILFKGMLAEASRICDEWHANRKAGTAGKVLTPGVFRVPENGKG